MENKKVNKERVTITLTSETLERIDNKVNENTLLYNRSLVIECVIKGELKLNPITPKVEEKVEPSKPKTKTKKVSVKKKVTKK